MSSLVRYGSGSGRVIAYDTIAKDGAVTFGVLLSEDGAAEHELNRRALAASKEFLMATGGDAAWVKISGCSRCHVDDLASFPDQLWHLPAFRAWILPKEGCAKPGERAP